MHRFGTQSNTNEHPVCHICEKEVDMANVDKHAVSFTEKTQCQAGSDGLSWAAVILRRISPGNFLCVCACLIKIQPKR